MRIFFAFSVLSFLAVTSAAWGGQPQPLRQQALIHLLKHDCGSCHGLTLKGGLGPPLTPEALSGKSAEMLADTIAYGLPATAMPPWQGLLSREEIFWLAERLREGVAP
ncbi:MAG: cytochrome c [Magnetococcales bacterium]|nr:cytochrome c [Magnetococcales bacterium]